jgi:SAM-dependent methyltransferase
MEASDVHPSAAHGFTAAAAPYERGRPEYPPEAIDFLVAVFGLDAGATLVDLAAGTGKLTRGLARTESFLVALEPLATMRAEFARALPLVRIVGAVAERMPLAHGAADAMVVANAWHWFDSEVAAAEAHRVLRRSGGLALIYNRRDESVAWVARLSEIIDEHRGDTPQYRSGRWREAFESSPWFAPLRRRDFKYPHRLSPALLRDRVASVSFIAQLDGARRKRVMDSVDELVVQEFGDRSEFTMPHTTEVYTTTAL